MIALLAVEYDDVVTLLVLEAAPVLSVLSLIVYVEDTTLLVVGNIVSGGASDGVAVGPLPRKHLNIINQRRSHTVLAI